MIKTGTDKITALQLFILMFQSRILVTLMYMPKGISDDSLTDIIIRLVIAMIIMLITAIPVRMLLADNNNNGFLCRCTELSRGFGKISAFLILAALAFFILRVALRFEIFTTTVIFPESNLKFFLVITIFACLYCVVLGLDVLGRTSEIFFGVVIVSLIFILAATASKLQLTNFTPPLYKGIKGPFMGSFYSLGVTIELIFPILLKDKVEGKKLICIYPWILITFGFLIVLVFWQTGVLGNYAATQLFPFFSLTSVTTAGFLERLDAVLTATWIVCEFVKLSICIFLAGRCIETLFPKLGRNKSLYVSAGIAILITLFIQENYKVRMIIANTTSVTIMYAVVVIVLPVILLSAERYICKQKESGSVAKNID